MGNAPTSLLPQSDCIVGRDSAIPDAPPEDREHYVKKGNRIYPPFPDGMEMIVLGMGCFWCSENVFANMDGVYSTHVGYAQGVTKNPTYQEICSGQTNHNEVTRVVYDPALTSLKSILATFWQMHDPTTPYQQGGDRGTQYRSGIYFHTESQKEVAENTMAIYQQALKGAGIQATIATEIQEAATFYYAEDAHQQYDAKPGSRDYCGLRPLGVKFPTE
jgi:peptide-methionine (S)-S-oxide reductase